MAPDGAIDDDILVANFRGAAIGGGESLATQTIAHHRHHLIERPFEIDCSGTCGEERRIGTIESLVRCIGVQGEADTVGRSRPDQRRTAHLHGGNRAGGIVQCR